MEWEMTDNEIISIVGNDTDIMHLRKLTIAAQCKALNYQHNAWWSKYLRPYIQEMLNASTKACK